MKSDSIVYEAAEEDMPGIQARELSTRIATLPEIVPGSGLLGSEPDTTLKNTGSNEAPRRAEARRPKRSFDPTGGQRNTLQDAVSEFSGELSATLSTTSHTTLRVNPALDRAWPERSANTEAPTQRIESE
jgi:hypothetical protein